VCAPSMVEPNFRQIVAGFARGADAGWREQMLMVGLAPDILQFPEEASRFDGFASVRGVEERCREVPARSRWRGKPNLTIATGKGVRSLLAGAGLGPRGCRV